MCACVLRPPQVGGGATDFYPTPAESRAIIGGSYGVSPTLVVRFADDSIDESLEMSALLKSRLGAGEKGDRGTGVERGRGGERERSQ